MPIYEYSCNACGHHLETLQKINDQPLLDCPKCCQSSLQRLISRSGFKLMGGGWYETDFKHKGKQETVKSSSKSDAKNTVEASPKTS